MAKGSSINGNADGKNGGNNSYTAKGWGEGFASQIGA